MTYTFNLLTSKPNIQFQRGQTCKLYALSNAMEWLSENYSNQPVPPIVRKQKLPNEQNSIRQLAKGLIGSEVGEVYGDLNLLKVAKDSGFTNFKSIECSTIAQYCAVIQTAIDHNLIPIVVFDVKLSGSNTGHPFNNNGLHEHAAVISSYFHTKSGELRFNAGQWGHYYGFSAIELAQSNFQLSEVRKPEMFIKSQGGWLNAKDFSQNDIQEMKKQGAILRQARRHDLKKHGTFKGRVIIGAPNGISYDFNVNNVVANPNPQAPKSRKMAGYVYSALASAIPMAYILNVHTSLASLSVIACLGIALATTMMLCGLIYVMWGKQHSQDLPPLIKVDPKKRILNINMKKIKLLQKAFGYGYEHRGVRLQSGVHSTTKPVLYHYQEAKDARKETKKAMPKDIYFEKATKRTDKMPLSQPF